MPWMCSYYVSEIGTGVNASGLGGTKTPASSANHKLVSMYTPSGKCTDLRFIAVKAPGCGSMAAVVTQFFSSACSQRLVGWRTFSIANDGSLLDLPASNCAIRSGLLRVLTEAVPRQFKFRRDRFQAPKASSETRRPMRYATTPKTIGPPKMKI